MVGSQSGGRLLDADWLIEDAERKDCQRVTQPSYTTTTHFSQSLTSFDNTKEESS